MNGALADNAATALSLQRPLQLVVSSFSAQQPQGGCHSSACLCLLLQLSKLHRVKQVFSHRHSREPTEVELLRLTGFHPQTLSRLQSAAALWEVDLDATPEDGSASLGETLSAQGEGSATEYSAQAQAKRELARAVAALPLEQASAIQMMYGLNQHGPMRAREVSVPVAVTVQPEAHLP